MWCRFDPWTIIDQQVWVQGQAAAWPLSAHAWDWACADARLQMRYFAAEPPGPLPAPEPSEPVIGALARLLQWQRAQQGVVVMLDDPAEALGLEHMPALQGVRLLGIRSPDDRSCWDAVLSLGAPVYGVYGDICCQVEQERPSSVISALAYGCFTSGSGADLAAFTEAPDHCSWEIAGPSAAAHVVVRGGMEAAVIEGREGAWHDAGHEGYVRVVFAADDGRRFAQPRMVAPRSASVGE